MEEEVKVVEEQPKEQEQEVVTESVSEDTITEIDQEIEKVEQVKIDQAKNEGAVSAVESLKKELEALKAANEAVLKQQAEEAEAARLRAEIEAEKARAQSPVKKHLVPPANNPNTPQAVEAPVAPKLTREQEWAEFERGFSRVSVSNPDNQ